MCPLRAVSVPGSASLPAHTVFYAPRIEEKVGGSHGYANVSAMRG